MTTTSHRPVVVSSLLLVLALVFSGFVVALDTPTAGASSASESSGRPDPVMGRDACLLMDRVYTATGCSRTACRRPGEQIRYSPNAETCTIGGRTGTSYGSEIDSRVCAQLHRKWVGAVNFCAANPHREQTLIERAPQCRKPFTTYVTTSRTDSRRATRTEAEGRYDVCLRPQQAARLAREARRTGRSLRSLAVSAARSVEQPGDDGPSVLVVGDSLTWRGTNELGALRPDWSIDGASGRNLRELDDRITHALVTRGLPTGVVLALGTNPAPGYDLDDLRGDLARLPSDTPVMVVLPYRERSRSNTAGQVRAVRRAATMLGQLAATRPRTCVADWVSLVDGKPSMLVDGTHQTRRVEGTWASFVSSQWDTCLAGLPAASAAPAPAP